MQFDVYVYNTSATETLIMSRFPRICGGKHLMNILQNVFVIIEQHIIRLTPASLQRDGRTKYPYVRSFENEKECIFLRFDIFS